MLGNLSFIPRMDVCSGYAITVAGSDDILAEVRLKGQYTSGYRMAIVSMTFKGNASRVLCRGEHEVRRNTIPEQEILHGACRTLQSCLYALICRFGGYNERGTISLSRGKSPLGLRLPSVTGISREMSFFRMPPSQLRRNSPESIRLRQTGSCSRGSESMAGASSSSARLHRGIVSIRETC